MAHKTFISYKYSEAQKLRDKIIQKLGNDAVYYQGETSASPNMTQSSWIEWEIKYALRTQSRTINGYTRTSQPNGIICVVQKQVTSNYTAIDSYDWAKASKGWLRSIFFPVLIDNAESGYIDIITEEDFLKNVSGYIEKTFKIDKNLIVRKT